MIKKIDHLVITATDMSATIEFYEKLGFVSQDRGNRYELYAGDFKINVHELGRELLPHAKNVQIGSGDFCFEMDGNLEELHLKLEGEGVEVELGIVERNGVRGVMRSIYLRDPDGNLVEISSYA